MELKGTCLIQSQNGPTLEQQNIPTKAYIFNIEKFGYKLPQA